MPDEMTEERKQEIKRRAVEFFNRPENAEVRLTPEEFMAMFDPDRDGMQT